MVLKDPFFVPCLGPFSPPFDFSQGRSPLPPPTHTHTYRRPWAHYKLIYQIRSGYCTRDKEVFVQFVTYQFLWMCASNRRRISSSQTSFCPRWLPIHCNDESKALLTRQLGGCTLSSRNLDTTQQKNNHAQRYNLHCVPGVHLCSLNIVVSLFPDRIHCLLGNFWMLAYSASLICNEMRSQNKFELLNIPFDDHRKLLDIFHRTSNTQLKKPYYSSVPNWCPPSAY